MHQRKYTKREEQQVQFFAMSNLLHQGRRKRSRDISRASSGICVWQLVAKGNLPQRETYARAHKTKIIYCSVHAFAHVAGVHQIVRRTLLLDAVDEAEGRTI